MRGLGSGDVVFLQHINPARCDFYYSARAPLIPPSWEDCFSKRNGFLLIREQEHFQEHVPVPVDVFVTWSKNRRHDVCDVW